MERIPVVTVPREPEARLPEWPVQRIPTSGKLPWQGLSCGGLAHMPHPVIDHRDPVETIDIPRTRIQQRERAYQRCLAAGIRNGVDLIFLQRDVCGVNKRRDGAAVAVSCVRHQRGIRPIARESGLFASGRGGKTAVIRGCVGRGGVAAVEPSRTDQGRREKPYSSV